MLPPSGKNELIALIKKYQQHRASPEEIAFIERYYDYFDQQELASPGLSKKDRTELENKLLQNITKRIDEASQSPVFGQTPQDRGDVFAGQRRSRKIFSFKRMVAAAIILLLLTAGADLWINRPVRRETASIGKASGPQKNDVAPGGNKAILLLADGSRIVLDSAHDGTIAQQGGARILKINGGLLAYKRSDGNSSGSQPGASPGEHSGAADPGDPSGLSSGNTQAIAYNTITTPRGGQYQVVLPDGTKVWLNAASSLRFPTSFTGRERNVQLSGEAYFEVAKNASHPFSVSVGAMKAEVLGTHFNINAYDDEATIRTTLLEGSVRVRQGNESMLLKPGQQARLNKRNELRLIEETDVEEAVAWKNGMFEFKSADIGTIMRQMARWYDVEIEYNKTVDEKFYAEISRNTNASDVFKILETTHAVHLRIDGRKVSVMPWSAATP